MKRGAKVRILRVVPQVGVSLALIGIAAVTNEIALYLIAVGYAGGYAIGGIVNYKWGMNDRKDILDHVYGEHWEKDAGFGSIYRASYHADPTKDALRWRESQARHGKIPPI